jgi:hypothetical protein
MALPTQQAVWPTISAVSAEHAREYSTHQRKLLKTEGPKYQISSGMSMLPNFEMPSSFPWVPCVIDAFFHNMKPYSIMFTKLASIVNTRTSSSLLPGPSGT